MSSSEDHPTGEGNFVAGGKFLLILLSLVVCLSQFWGCLLNPRFHSKSFIQVEDADKFHDDTEKENMSTKFSAEPVGGLDTTQGVDINNPYGCSAGLAGTDIEMQTIHLSDSIDGIKEDYMKDDEDHPAVYPVSSGSTKVGTLSRSFDGQLHPAETCYWEWWLMFKQHQAIENMSKDRWL